MQIIKIMWDKHRKLQNNLPATFNNGLGLVNTLYLFIYLEDYPTITYMSTEGAGLSSTQLTVRNTMGEPESG